MARGTQERKCMFVQNMAFLTPNIKGISIIEEPRHFSHQTEEFHYWSVFILEHAHFYNPLKQIQ